MSNSFLNYLIMQKQNERLKLIGYGELHQLHERWAGTAEGYI